LFLKKNLTLPNSFKWRKNRIFFQRLAYLFLVIVLGYIILKQGKFFMGPLAFSIFFTIMLQSLLSFFQRLVKYNIPAIILTLLSVAAGSSHALHYQELEGNIITHRVAGSSVLINPLFALIAIIPGG
jgi:predicted PurR-regulated permease PerM